MVRIEDLTQRHWAGEAAATGEPVDGFHAPRWTALDLQSLLAGWEALAREAEAAVRSGLG